MAKLLFWSFMAIVTIFKKLSAGEAQTAATELSMSCRYIRHGKVLCLQSTDSGSTHFYWVQFPSQDHTGEWNIFTTLGNSQRNTQAERLRDKYLLKCTPECSVKNHGGDCLCKGYRFRQLKGGVSGGRSDSNPLQERYVERTAPLHISHTEIDLHFFNPEKTSIVPEKPSEERTLFARSGTGPVGSSPSKYIRLGKSPTQKRKGFFQSLLSIFACGGGGAYKQRENFDIEDSDRPGETPRRSRSRARKTTANSQSTSQN